MKRSKEPVIFGYVTVLLVTGLIVSCIGGASMGAEATGESMLDMSLEELMQVPVSGSITETDPHRVPVSVTTITAEDIAVTPARNLLDLIEIYVPGSMWMSSGAGPLLALRGIISDRNTKVLVLVNGIKVNNGIALGAISELSLWNLADIEKVEVIRGPGSVIYGPGAIAGVINITLKNAKTSPGAELGAFYWDRYISRGGHISEGMVGKNKDTDVYGYFSWTESLGLRPEVWMTNGTDVYFIGAPFNSRHRAATFLGSFYDDPQIKAYVNADFKNGWRFWTRYTDGLVPNNSTTTRQFDVRGVPATAAYMGMIQPVDFYGIRNRQYIATFENKQKLNEDFDAETTLSYSSTELKIIDKWIQGSSPNWYDNNQNNMRNIGTWVTEDKFFSRLQINYDPKNIWKAAFGAEYSYTMFGPGWYRDADNGFKINDMVSGRTSEAYPYVTQSNYLPLGNGWKVNQYALFGEVNIELTDKLMTILSARMDKHSYTSYMWSPRAAIEYELVNDQFIKFVAQRSLRMNTEDELYRLNATGANAKPEKLETYELMYHAFDKDDFSFKASTFYNDQQVIAWNSTNKRVEPVGELKTIGVELETAYKQKSYDVGLNHSYVKQLDWQLADGVQNSGVSYSDYYYSTTRNISGTIYPVTLNDTGNDLNNYSNHITKFFGNIKFFDGKVILHGDAKVFWDMPGNKNGFRMLEKEAETNPAINTRAIEPLESQGVYDLMINGNVSLTYKFTGASSIGVFVQNIPIRNTNKRYIYDSGIKRYEVERVGWIKEPLTVGVKFTAKF